MSVKDRPMMLNGDSVVRISEIPDNPSERRGCRVYLSLNDFIDVDQSLNEVMIALGFEQRG